MQQINLYQNFIKQNQQKQQVVLYAGLLGLLGLGVTAYSVYVYSEVGKLEHQVTVQRNLLESEQARLTQLIAKQPSAEVNRALVEEVGHWQNSLNELTQTLQVMSDTANMTNSGFSTIFQALARQSIPTVWLTKVTITGAQQNIDLEGSTFKPGEIPVFLQKLQTDMVFAGKSFARLTLLPDEKIPQQTNFKLRALLDEPEKKAVTEPKSTPSAEFVQGISGMLKQNIDAH